MLAVFLGAASLIGVGGSHAHWETGATLITANVAYLVAESTQTNEALHGASFNGALQMVIPGQPFSFGLEAASLNFDENGELPGENGGEEAEIRMRATPVYGTFKFWFGGNHVRGYTGLGLGYHTSKLETSVGGDYRTQTATGFAMTVPLGAVLFLGSKSSKIFLNGNVALYVLGDSFVESNLTGMANFGMGLKLADW
jgi:hypothetical protein